MDFGQTGLPDRPLFRAAFDAGFDRACAAGAAERYFSGPVAMARLIERHGGGNHRLAAAACLAGPAVFTREQDEGIDADIRDFACVIMAVESTDPRSWHAVIPSLSVDARLFLQASAVMSLDGVASETAYVLALDLYTSARGVKDAFGLDGVLGEAAMRAAASLKGRNARWLRDCELVSA